MADARRPQLRSGRWARDADGCWMMRPGMTGKGFCCQARPDLDVAAGERVAGTSRPGGTSPHDPVHPNSPRLRFQTRQYADMVASSSFRPLAAVLQGLRSHDERPVEQLASRALTSGKCKVHVWRDEDGQIVGAGGEDQERDDDTQAAAEAALLHFSSPRDAATIAAFLRTRVYRPESMVWLEGYQALIRWRKDNEITGLYAIPYDIEVEVGVTKDFPLGRWVHQQRKALRTGELEERRKTLLDAPEAGMVWEPGEEAWESKLAALRSYRRATGHLAPRQDAV